MAALFDACLDGLERAIDMRAKSGFEDSYFLLEAFRTDGAALQEVKQFKLDFEKSSSALPNEPNEIVGLLVHHLRVDDTCITCDDKGRAGLVSLGQTALLQAQEAIKQARNNSNKSMSEANGSDGLNTTEQLPNDSSSSDEDENKVNDDDEEDDDGEENEMQIQVEAHKLLSPATLAVAVRDLSVQNRARADRFVKLLHHCATHHPSPTAGEEEDNCFFNLALYFAPMLSKPANTAYLSIRHTREVPALRLVLWVWIEHYPEICTLLAACGEEDEAPQSPRVRPVTTNSAYNSPASSSLKTYASNNSGSNLKPRLSASSQEMKQKLAATTWKRGAAASPQLLAAGKKKLSSSDIDSLVGKSLAIARFFNIENRLEAMAWLNQQAPPATATITKTSRWANEARLEIEKRVLKKRLLQWDREFETKHARKPTKEDRLEVKGVFTAYAAVKILLKAVKDDSETEEDLELLEKKALQAVLKLFERDFQEKMKRKVEFSTDIVGREMEYTRYKELKEQHS